MAGEFLPDQITSTIEPPPSHAPGTLTTAAYPPPSIRDQFQFLATAASHNHNGQYLAVGYTNGSVIIYSHETGVDVRILSNLFDRRMEEHKTYDSDNEGEEPQDNDPLELNPLLVPSQVVSAVSWSCDAKKLLVCNSLADVVLVDLSVAPDPSITTIRTGGRLLNDSGVRMSGPGVVNTVSDAEIRCYDDRDKFSVINEHLPPPAVSFPMGAKVSVVEEILLSRCGGVEVWNDYDPNPLLLGRKWVAEDGSKLTIEDATTAAFSENGEKIYVALGVIGDLLVFYRKPGDNKKWDELPIHLRVQGVSGVVKKIQFCQEGKRMLLVGSGMLTLVSTSHLLSHEQLYRLHRQQQQYQQKQLCIIPPITPLNRLQHKKSVFIDATFSGDGKFVAAGIFKQRSYALIIFCVETGGVVRDLKGPETSLTGVVWNPWEWEIGVTTIDGCVDVWGIEPTWTAFAPDFKVLEKNVVYQGNDEEEGYKTTVNNSCGLLGGESEEGESMDVDIISKTTKNDDFTIECVMKAISGTTGANEDEDVVAPSLAPAPLVVPANIAAFKKRKLTSNIKPPTEKKRKNPSRNASIFVSASPAASPA